MHSDAIDAIHHKDLEKLNTLITSGLDLNRLDYDGRTPLIHAILSDRNNAEIVEVLLQHGANPNIHDRLLGWTALHYAVRDQKSALVAILLSYGANPDEEDNFGDTPLWRCMTDAVPSPIILRMLIDRGANPNRRHPIGISARDIATSLGTPDVSAALGIHAA